ncbi:hypothetical protein EON09_06590 [Pseudomonas soli]|uniref:hypothetical protein n=1 Tax=Pseudomonas TaxID=286 RepID=UPI001364A68B|nr:hypothetical protein [Pseudomonas soli]NBK38196.1 hypothetical protein [Pseudomonas soli]WJO19903.1 hypothetical protein LU688_16570 [Pseudomonas soli]
MTRLALCLLLLATLTGCQPDCWSSDPGQCKAESSASQLELLPMRTGFYVYHDDQRSVTCWSTSAGLSCLPDWMLRGQSQAGNERQLSPHETQPEPTPAAAPAAWNDERYQL